MPKIFKEEYEKRVTTEGEVLETTPTVQSFKEADGTDVRLDRVRVFNPNGNFVKSYLQDKMGAIFKDNLSNTEDDLIYLNSLPNKEIK